VATAAAALRLNASGSAARGVASAIAWDRFASGSSTRVVKLLLCWSAPRTGIGLGAPLATPLTNSTRARLVQDLALSSNRSSDSRVHGPVLTPFFARPE
jgi:hypothetical protein